MRLPAAEERRDNGAFLERFQVRTPASARTPPAPAEIRRTALRLSKLAARASAGFNRDPDRQIRRRVAAHALLRGDRTSFPGAFAFFAMQVPRSISLPLVVYPSVVWKFSRVWFSIQPLFLRRLGPPNELPRTVVVTVVTVPCLVAILGFVDTRGPRLVGTGAKGQQNWHRLRPGLICRCVGTAVKFYSKFFTARLRKDQEGLTGKMRVFLLRTPGI